MLEYDEHDLAGLAACTELGGLRLGQVKRLAWQLFTALEQSHHDGILHRDVKASNLLVDKTGNLKLADWGLAVDGRARTKRLFPRRSPRAAIAESRVDAEGGDAVVPPARAFDGRDGVRRAR